MGRQPSATRATTTKSVPQPRLLPDIESSLRGALEGVVSQGSLKTAVERVTAVMISENFSGPLPHPMHLSGYEAVLPGSADRIITMAENTIGARHALQERVVVADISDRKLGMWLGAMCFVGLILAALVSNLLTGGVAVPGLFLGAGAVGAIATFVNGRLKDKQLPQGKDK